ncbi:rho GTPase-activating protein 5-like [Cornus florida]|uniref:rho GTPase-activating protein 5-like n=1 Tax=Cornus florida TaxID=4283 RepID=UPI002898EBAE|nr:rho GTPase-activating protein 5-like [Cornus florida]
MTEILQSPSHLPSSSSSIPCVVSPTLNDGSHQQAHLNHEPLFNNPTSYCVAVCRGDTEEEEEREGVRERKEAEEGDQLSLLALLVTVFRKSLIASCSSERVEELSSSMEIGCPTNVRHVAHVTFDRFNGFLGLPVEFEPEVPRRPPSASASVFGVSTESMQLSFDSRGNSVPTILLMMQRRLYAQGGLQAEGIFRINAENGQEEYVREQLNRGIVPHDIDVHCLAGLIKAWFRELPNGVLDSLSPEQVMQAQSEEECTRLVRLLPPTVAALLDWAINLMADVALLEHLNKMNARNIAMVFAPNMTQMADPLTALMHAVQVMNFLKTLIVRTLREREDSILESATASHLEPSDENGHHSYSQPIIEEADEMNQEEQVFVPKEPFSESPAHPNHSDSEAGSDAHGFLTSIGNIIPGGNGQLADNCPGELPNQVDSTRRGLEKGGSSRPNGGTQSDNCRTKTGQSSNSNIKKGSKRVNNNDRTVVRATGPVDKIRGTSIVSRLNSWSERVEAWR